MAGFSSMDDFVDKITVKGNIWRTDWNKAFLPTTAAVAGEWHCLLRGAGSPGPDTIMNTGPNNTFQPLSGTTSGINSISAGPNVSGSTYPTAYKQIINASAGSAAATTMPSVLMLVDVLGFYRVTGVTSIGDQNLTNVLTLPRYTNGLGVQCFIYNSNATALGAATPNIYLTYTRTGGRGTTITPSGLTSPLPVGKTAASNGLILYSGSAGVGKYGPFMPLADDDNGMINVTKINLNVSYVSGEFSIVLCKPILSLPMTTVGVFTERDFLNQVPSLPKVYDGACLTWLLHSGAATPVSSVFFGHLDFGW